MSRDVAEGWRLTTFSDIASDVSARNRSRDEIPVLSVTKYDGFVPSEEYFKKKVFSADTENYKIVRKGQFAYATIHLDEGSIDRLTRFDVGLISPMYTVFEIDERQADPDFILRLFKFYATDGQFDALGNGGVNRRKSISFSTLGKLSIPLPSLREQRRIAEILSSVDDAIAATRAVIEQSRKVKQGVLERLLTKGTGHTRFKQTEIGEIPEGWEVAEVQEHFHVQLGKMLSKAAKVGSSPSPYLRNANVQWGRIHTEDLLYMDFSEQEKEKFRLQPGDLLVCEGGEVGRCAIWNDGREMYYQKALHRLRERTGVVKSQFLMYVLLRLFTSKALSAGLVGTNSIAHFTREQFLRLKFPVPDADEQNVICETLGALDVSINENISKTEALLSLKSALMSDLLTGRKRVTEAVPMAAE